MGYTHYWTHNEKFTPAEWVTIAADVETILKTAVADGLKLGDGFGENAIEPRATIGKNGISFNGLDEDSLETFGIGPEPQGWDFCKTERKPYDVAVTAILAYLESAHPDKFSVGSDGDKEDWQPGIALLKKALGTRAAFAAVPAEVLADS